MRLAASIDSRSATRSEARTVSDILNAHQFATGTILVDEPAVVAGGVAIYAGVSSADERGDVDRRVARVVEHSTGVGMAPARVVSDVGSGLDGYRTKLVGLLRDRAVGSIVVECRDRLARFGAEYLAAALAAQGRRLVVVDSAEVTDDLVRDMVEVLTSFCAGLYRRRSARRRAEMAVAVAGKAPAPWWWSTRRIASSWTRTTTPAQRWLLMSVLPGSSTTGVCPW